MKELLFYGNLFIAHVLQEVHFIAEAVAVWVHFVSACRLEISKLWVGPPLDG